MRQARGIFFDPSLGRLLRGVALEIFFAGAGAVRCRSPLCGGGGVVRVGVPCGSCFGCYYMLHNGGQPTL